MPVTGYLIDILGSEDVVSEGVEAGSPARSHQCG